MRFVLLVGCLSLSACAASLTVRLRSLSRKSPGFPPTYRNNVVQFSGKLRRSSPKVLEPIRATTHNIRLIKRVRPC